MNRTDRSQVVLLAAVVVAVALVPMVLAYLQLGYHPAIASPDPDRGLAAERILRGATVTASAGIPGEYSWSERTAAVSAVRARLAPSMKSLNRSTVTAGTAYLVTYNDTIATRIAATDCPSGPNRQFGPCRAYGGVVVQRRAGQTHVLAVAFDVQIATRSGDWRLHLSVRPR